MKNILTIIKKEFIRFFTDPRMVLLTVILPGVMIFSMYSFIGEAISNMLSIDEDYSPIVYVNNYPQSIKAQFEYVNISATDDYEITEDEIFERIQNKDIDIYIIFPADFDIVVSEYDVTNPEQTAPNIEIYYNSTKKESEYAYQLVAGVLDAYENSLANKFDINNTDTKYDLASDKDVSGMIFSSMLPMLMMIFLFSSCMGIAPESIAGEKERGTIATLLVTPISRTHLAIGKIISLATFATLGGLCSFLGLILSLPKLLGGTAGLMDNAFAFTDYAMLLVIILSTILMIVSLLSIISAMTKSVKEATALIFPFMIIAMLTGVTSMFGGGAPDAHILYIIPFYNSVQSMNGVSSFDYKLINIIITAISNLAYTILFAFILSKMFKSERIMFSKS